jgi:rapamycin-insensitive companion of mTOR
MSLGLPFNTVISNYLVDLKDFYYSEIDDMKFANKLKFSGVLMSKDYRRWNWPVVNEILEGNLLTPHRLEDVMKKTKFIKRLLSFFMPSK